MREPRLARHTLHDHNVPMCVRVWVVGVGVRSVRSMRMMDTNNKPSSTQARAPSRIESAAHAVHPRPPSPPNHTSHVPPKQRHIQHRTRACSHDFPSMHRPERRASYSKPVGHRTGATNGVSQQHTHMRIATASMQCDAVRPAHRAHVHACMHTHTAGGAVRVYYHMPLADTHATGTPRTRQPALRLAPVCV